MDEGIAASTAERALAGNNMPQVVITMACLPGRNYLRTDSRRYPGRNCRSSSPRRRCESRQQCRAGTGARHRRSPFCGEPRLRRKPEGAVTPRRCEAGPTSSFYFTPLPVRSDPPPVPVSPTRRGLTTLSPNAAHGVSPGQAAAIDCRVGFGFASRKLRHSPACSAEMKKRLPPVALSRITIPCSDVCVITTSPTHGSFRTSGEAPIASWVVDEVDEVEGGEDDSPLWPRQPVKTQVEKIATTSGKIDFSTAPLPLITGPRILLRG